MTFYFTIVKYISEEFLGRPVLLVGQWALGDFAKVPVARPAASK